jgi:DNA-binding GntR family transcriptional regulator
MNTDKPIDMGARPGNLAEQVLDRLRAAIQEGRYVPGQRLIESDLMGDFGVNRGPLREALRRLGTEGAVELIPNRGAVVRRFSKKELANLFKIRAALEGLAARLAAERIELSDNRKRFADELLHVPILGVNDPARQFGDENKHFHHLLIRFSDNPQLDLLLKQAQLPIVRFQVRAALDEEHRARSRREHQSVADAVLDGNADAAEALMRSHLSQAFERILLRSDAFDR